MSTFKALVLQQCVGCSERDHAFRRVKPRCDLDRRFCTNSRRESHQLERSVHLLRFRMFEFSNHVCGRDRPGMDPRGKKHPHVPPTADKRSSIDRAEISKRSGNDQLPIKQRFLGADRVTAWRLEWRTKAEREPQVGSSSARSPHLGSHPWVVRVVG